LKAFREHPDHGSYHCDIVVGFDVADPKKAGVVYAIGGNVINAVSLTEAPIHNGRVTKVRTPSGRNWFTVLKLNAGTGTADFRRIPPGITDEAERVAKRRLQGVPKNVIAGR